MTQTKTKREPKCYTFDQFFHLGATLRKDNTIIPEINRRIMLAKRKTVNQSNLECQYNKSEEMKIIVSTIHDYLPEQLAIENEIN